MSREKTSAKRFTDGAVLLREVAPNPLMFDCAVSVPLADGARRFWHAHQSDQMLIGISGRGWLRYRDGEANEIVAGSTVVAQAGEEHWHGAAAGEDFTHVGLTSDDSEWLERVEDPD